MTTPAPINSGISPENYAFLQKHVYRISGIVLEENKHYLLDARLLPIVRKEELRNLDDLCALLRMPGSTRVQQQVRDAMTTNETLFFRDALPFKALRNSLIPQRLLDSGGSGRLSFWSAAASTGQEAYSLVMMLLDVGLDPGKFEILATDLSDRVLDQARAGRYSQAEVGRGLPAQQLVRYFRREHADWVLKDEVRRLVRFQSFDLRNRMNTLGRFDFVLCRNVLIYFDVETKKNIFKEIEGVMKPHSYLLLGGAETTLNLTESFERKSFEGVSFFQLRT